ncbi:MAG: hypothetical protein KDI98_07915 [Hyphomicrobiaceae bacterium]|nr:hypothetical protein [Hyphomicrobiaceae bacterium]
MVRALLLSALSALAGVLPAGAFAGETPREALNRLWPDYVAAFTTQEGRVVDNGNGAITHSEGQGYALLLAAETDDRPVFDRLFAFTRSTLMIREDGLAAWVYDPELGHVRDRNNATDGDLLIAYALIEGGERWDDAALRFAARRMTRALLDGTVSVAGERQILLPGASGFDAEARTDGPVVNLSYYVFPAFRALSELDPQARFDVLERDALALMEESRFGPRGLPSDWVALGGEAPQPAEGFDPIFGYDAIRIPLYLAWAGAGQRQHLAPFVAEWSETPPSIVWVADGSVRSAFAENGYRAVAALVACVMNGTPPDPALFQRLDPLYYPATLQLLSLLALDERQEACP